jgi:hypothetical protein
MNTTESTTFAGLHIELLADGFQPGPPPSLCRDAQRIDREVCQEARCDECGHRGLDYRPYHSSRSYRALAVCPACNNTFEF